MIDIHQLKKSLKKILFKYNAQKLSKALDRLGIQEGDVLMVHSSWLPDNGFAGTAKQFIDSLKSAIGDDGLLAMMSMPYQNESTKQYLSKNLVFKVKRTPSKVGLLTEVFRRGKNVVRSFNSAHPVVAWGGGSKTFVADHNLTECSFGKGSPFDKLAQLDGKILLVDAPFNTITFNHYLESLNEADYPVQLFDHEVVRGRVLDEDGAVVGFSTKVLAKESSGYRIDDRLEAEMDKRGLIRRLRVGGTRLILVNTSDLVLCASACVQNWEK
ncbi:AAC(3) family N-acetyltransferase [Neptunomonas antarctica]|uniref:Aminoglycoside N(3)-acetyltransferase n=1 Tax=Neptunomonas antarctica TaxID=619304 RepID=A0A1N7JEN4_9GAMM|nr:AAC(3) family N-acetyltransferase [Neptunomonas antarctica]SIS47769.1 aminoglycoside 3-N-acetyltransferase [Neptunomonas antarctica]